MFNGIQTLDCDLIRGGINPILARLPETGGVYAWFKKILPPSPESSTAQQFAEFIIAETSLPHMLARTAQLPPLYSVTVRSSRRFSDAKRSHLLELCEQISFRRFVAELVLSGSVLFQNPLYIGKADSIVQRVGEHLRGQSGLRERLDKASINIFRCILVYVEVPAELVTGSPGTSANLIVEEMLSKLFCPPFTERYG